ncbi:glycosyltransferase family 4 protein [Haloglomus litoreum]|uniref:glycosyltransferase family 4 protein n=1 Tax=Haloglomus litoreum TaxID=3034026 RepID=UPI0023E84E3C|nr:glycosyltransferase family 4 protein [Haloglomus sp. DT116]
MRVVLLTLNAYDMLVGDGETVGGAQLQQVLIGRALADRGHDVIFVENDAEHKTETTVDGVRIVTRPSREDGNAILRAVLRLLDLTALLGRIDPDACYVRMPLFELLPTAVYCAVTHTRLVYGFAHDSELGTDPVVFESRLTDNAVYRRAIRTARATADVLVAQNAHQERLARKQYDCPVVRIPNGYEPRDDPGPSPFPDDRPVVLWVSTLRPWKRPELVLELADRIPEALFVIVGPAADEAPELYERVREGARQRDNVRFEGFVPYEEVDAYFAAADLFCNTSTDEGFPNTFLQAWAYGTPVATLTVDPDGIVSSEPVGVHGDGDVDRLAAAIDEALGDTERLGSLETGAREHFRRHHAIGAVADRYERVLGGSDD